MAVSALARAVGTPAAAVFGVYSDFFTAIYAPFTEEVLKTLPILLVRVYTVNGVTPVQETRDEHAGGTIADARGRARRSAEEGGGGS